MEGAEKRKGEMRRCGERDRQTDEKDGGEGKSGLRVEECAEMSADGDVDAISRKG